MKKVAIMQPYFFPYVGYLSLIKNTDEFILFDTAQFMRHGWIERNRILKQNEGWLYIKVPLEKHHQQTAIKDVAIDNATDWQAKMLAQLATYKKVAPHYKPVSELVKGVIYGGYTDVVSLNKAALEAVCKYLGITANIKVFSKMDLTITEAKAPDEWALRICEAMGDVDEYWNPPGGQEFFDKAKYDDANIALKFQNVKLETYDQKRPTFEAGLSIIDVLMFNSPETVMKMLDSYELS